MPVCHHSEPFITGGVVLPQVTATRMAAVAQGGCRALR